MKVKHDEENFDEAESQAYRCWTESVVPSDIAALFQDPALSSLSHDSPPFFHLLVALQRFTLEEPHVLPLTSTLPDMKASTDGYIQLQRMYKDRAEEEKERFKGLLGIPVQDDVVDLFSKNAHALKVLRGKRWGTLDRDPVALGMYLFYYCSRSLRGILLSSQCNGQLSKTSCHSFIIVGAICAQCKAARDSTECGNTHQGGTGISSRGDGIA